MSNPKRIAVLGSTGSIGTQALEVIASSPVQLAASVLTANQNAPLLIEQALRHRPSAVVICDEKYYDDVKAALRHEAIEVLSGADGLSEVVQRDDVDMVLAALVGFSGLKSVIKAIESGKDIALANKETLVVAGEIIMQLAAQRGVNLIPVDSEHSAIFQCLVGEEPSSVSRIMITASGGPFRGWSRESLQAVTKAQALKHPKWNMGDKITIDSATLMNKGLEIIEAHWLFGLPQEKIDVVVHPQSIIHSMVHFHDGSIKAQLSPTDMRYAIMYALAFPTRLYMASPEWNWITDNELTFEAPDQDTFPCIRLARQALSIGGTAPCVLNAANEVAVRAFLDGEIGFLEIADFIAAALERSAIRSKPDFDMLVETDRATRDATRQLIAKITAA